MPWTEPGIMELWRWARYEPCPLVKFCLDDETRLFSALATVFGIGSAKRRGSHATTVVLYCAETPPQLVPFLEERKGRHQNPSSNKFYPLTTELEHLRISVCQRAFHPICVFLSSSPDTQRSQRPGNFLEMGHRLESNDTSKASKPQQATRRKCLNGILTPFSVSPCLFYPQSLAFSIQAGDLNHLVAFVPFPYHFNWSAIKKGNSGSSNSCFNGVSSPTKHISRTFHFSFSPYSTSVGSVLFIPFSRWRSEAQGE